MSGHYHKVGTTLRVPVVLSDPGGNLLTGVTSGDMTFRLSKDGTGNQSTTGITFAEIDGTNNPGVYLFTVSGSTGFVSATGTYELFFFRTADGEDYGQTFTIFCTSDGTGSGSWGDASFTPTSGDGRFTDGTDPLEGVTVRITDSSGTLIYRSETDSSGLFNTVYFDADDTYTVSGQKSGYTAGNYTITVSGTTATGPGADESMPLSTSSSTIVASELTKYALRGYFDYSGSKADDEALDIVNDALQRVADEYPWSCLHKVKQITLRAKYETGTIAITSGGTTVTLTGGTWPTWAGSAELLIDGIYYAVSSRTSDSVLELVDAFGAATISGESYELIQIAYDLPDQTMMIDEALWPDNFNRPQLVSKAVFDVRRNYYHGVPTTPGIWSYADQKLWLLPAVSDDQNVNILYYKMPDEVTDTSDSIVDFPRVMLPLLRKSVAVEVCLRSSDNVCAYGDIRQLQSEYQIAVDKAVANMSQQPVDGQLYQGRYPHSQDLDDIELEEP